MRPLALNFVRRRRVGSPLGFLLLAAGCAVSGAVALEYLDANEEAQRAEARLARLARQARQEAPARQRAAASLAPADELAAARQIAARLRLPWDAVLRELESLGDASVALLSVDGDGKGRTLRIEGEAKTLAEAVAYVERLRQSPWFGAAHLSAHEEMQDGDVKLIHFSLEAAWNAPL